jgi:hypothetical protein
VIFYKVAGANEPSTVTYSVSGAETFMGLSLLEYEGLHDVQSEVLDRVVSQSGSGTSVSTGTTATTDDSVKLLAFDGFAQQAHVGEELRACWKRQVTQMADLGFCKQYAVAGQELRVAHNGEPAGQPPQHRRVLAAQRRPDPVLLPIGHASPRPRQG